MGSDWWKQFVRAVLIRATKTLFQAGVAGIGTAVVMGQVDWLYVASSSVLAALVSMAMSVATGLPEVEMPKIPEEGDV